ncbi:hypothetical protein QT972_06995 [Microcoleus sp. herbarium7]|uniref:hypothetical protein n=2 Tax=Microcoleus TaxID=44471 RepID=UPI002FCEA45D
MQIKSRVFDRSSNAMNQFLFYFASGLIALLVGYFTNQLPNLPDNWKPWVPLALAVLTLVSSILLIQQSHSGNSSAKTTIRGNTLAGNQTSIKATDALVEKNKLTGEGSSISTRDSDSGTQP